MSPLLTTKQQNVLERLHTEREINVEDLDLQETLALVELCELSLAHYNAWVRTYSVEPIETKDIPF